jgi:hypothetical protein
VKRVGRWALREAVIDEILAGLLIQSVKKLKKQRFLHSFKIGVAFHLGSAKIEL